LDREAAKVWPSSETLSAEPSEVAAGKCRSKERLAEARKIHGNFGKDRELKPIYLHALQVIATRWGGPKARFWHGLAVRAGGVGKQKGSK
jgi:hypothetical protein